MKRVLIILLLLFGTSNFSHKLADVLAGTFTFEGTIYFNDKIIGNEEIRIVHHYANKSVTQNDIDTIQTNSLGKYSYSLEWGSPCRSGNYSGDNKNTREKAFNKTVREWNPEYIGFVYKSEEIKIQNPYFKYLKTKKWENNIAQDIHFSN